SAVVTLLGHRALGDRLKTYFIDSGLMRQDEPEEVVRNFAALGVEVMLADESGKFFDALKGETDPEKKRDKGITEVFYKKVFGPIVRESGAKFLLHGTNKTDVDETVAGVKRQHNILVQLGIDTEKEYGYKVLEPLVELRKDGIRQVGKALGLPVEIYTRPPFPGPGLSVRVLGEVTRESIEMTRKADKIVCEELVDSGAFQYLAILHKDKVTGIRDGQREFGHQIEVRCWESKDARIATPTELPWDKLLRLGERLTSEIPGVVSATYNITKKPPSTIEGE
ncbi:MAG: ExsB family transcriptional regulator, partial [Candidatus Eisenbacteria sp.]|nr:ExsB family transcriptional regulator [Candidatus Eisenbacteria bacterium]